MKTLTIEQIEEESLRHKNRFPKIDEDIKHIRENSFLLGVRYILEQFNIDPDKDVNIDFIDDTVKINQK
jgi:hypothetical protein